MVTILTWYLEFSSDELLWSSTLLIEITICNRKFYDKNLFFFIPVLQNSLRTLAFYVSFDLQKVKYNINLYLLRKLFLYCSLSLMNFFLITCSFTFSKHLPLTGLVLSYEICIFKSNSYLHITYITYLIFRSRKKERNKVNIIYNSTLRYAEDKTENEI